MLNGTERVRIPLECTDIAATIIDKSGWNAAENGCECTLSSLLKPGL